MIFLPQFRSFRRGPGFLAESREFFARAGVTSSLAKTQIDGFVKGTQELGIWPNLIVVPCRSSQGALYQLGGSSKRTDHKWTLAGDATVTAAGVTGSGGHGSTSPYTDNYINPVGVSFSTANNPQLMGEAWSQDFSDVIPTQNEPIIYYNTVRQSYAYIGLAYGGATQILGGGGTAGALYTGAVSDPECYRNRNRPVLMAGTFRTNLPPREIINGKVYVPSSPNGTTSNIALNPCFTFPATPDNPATVYFCLWYFGDLTTLGASVWQQFWPLACSTLLSDMNPGGFIRFHMGGQSNSRSEVSLAVKTDVLGNNTGGSEVWLTSEGGEEAHHWVGDYPNNARTAAYESNFWKGDGTGTLEKQRPVDGIGTWADFLFWIQGEQDISVGTDFDLFKANTQALISFLREDLGKADQHICLGKVDYKASYRGASAQGDFTIDDFTGGGTDGNETYNIQALGTPTDDYSWVGATNATTIQRTGGRWEIRLSGGLLLTHSGAENPTHPQLVTSWSDEGYGTPVIDTTYTGRIEGIRTRQQEIADSDANVSIVDTRGLSRSDDVHLDATGGAALAALIKAVMVDLGLLSA